MTSSGILRFANRVVLVTGAGNGLGREYALAFGARGAKVVVNDLGGDIKGEGQSSRPADIVVDEIKKKGGVAVANYDSVEEGEKLVKTALDNFGRIDIIVNNAGILRDKSFTRISDMDWDIIHRIHLRSVFLITRAAWPYMKEQNFGRIIMVPSSAGIYGNFGQANYSAAKLGVVGLMNTLAIEGKKNNILVNSVAPMAGSRLTQTVMPQAVVDALKPEYVAPLVLWLCHESCQETGSLFECGAGIVAKLRWQRTPAVMVRRPGVAMTPEDVQAKWSEICDFTSAETPANIQEANMAYFKALQTFNNNNNNNNNNNAVEPNNTAATTNNDNNNLSSVVGHQVPVGKFSYSERDAILYALGVGVSTRQPDYLKWLFESSSEFSVLPSYAVIPAMAAQMDLFMKGNIRGIHINPAMILHGEQYVEVFQPLASSDTLTSSGYITDVLDKGTGAVIVINIDSFNAAGVKVAFNQSVIFLQQAGGFGGKRTSDKLIATCEPPSRTPCASITEQTSVDQAALYRLSGDGNPLHIDPQFAALGGFSQPILHGLCSFGFAARHILKQFADNDVTRFKAIKVRFSRPVIPGQSLRTDMWKDANRIYFQCTVVETGKQCLTGAYVDLHDPSCKSKL